MMKLKGFKSITLKNDIARGVRTLSDRNYYYEGVTNGSLKFWDSVKNVVGQVKSATFIENSRGYKMVLRTVDNYTLSFYGCSFGYHGEGSRGSATILLDAGFTHEQVNKVFSSKSNFRLLRQVHAEGDITAIAKEIRTFIDNDVVGAIFSVKINRQWANVQNEPRNLIYVQGGWGFAYRLYADTLSSKIHNKITEIGEKYGLEVRKCEYTDRWYITQKLA